MTNAKIFSAAWTVAKQGAAKFGGSSKDYFAESLKMVYATIKSNMTYAMQVGNVRSAWVAKITGKDAKFGYARQFVYNRRYNGSVARLNSGLYQIDINGRRSFVEVANGDINTLSEAEMDTKLALMA